MLFLYNLSIRLYGIGIWTASWFSPKAALWIKGRKHWAKNMADLRPRDYPNQKLIWVHCASLGEFEQGRPVIEAIKTQMPDSKILLTFFSPSGYEIRKNYDKADLILYLPLDTASNAHTFVQFFRPDLAIFVKYEFWHHFLQATKAGNGKLILISGIFHPHQAFFKWYGGFFRQMLRRFDWLFLQENNSGALLKNIQIQNFTVVGDTRVDRVAQLASRVQGIPFIADFSQGHKVLIVGSSWPKDEQILIPFLNRHLPQDWKVIIAPHQIQKSLIINLKNSLSLQTILYSETAAADPDRYRILIIDNVGMLSTIYQYGTIAYIGGGFGKGIHNTLEPMAFGLPVIFGPKYTKFREAVAVKAANGAFSVTSTEAFFSAFKQLCQPDHYQTAANAAKKYIDSNTGASSTILKYIQENI